MSVVMCINLLLNNENQKLFTNTLKLIICNLQLFIDNCCHISNECFDFLKFCFLCFKLAMMRL